MEWEDDAFVLSARAHGETGAIVELLTAQHGKWAAHVAGGASRKMKPFLQAGARVIVRFRSRISEQHRRLGASADWSREAFTMDAPREQAVRTTFKRLYDDGLIYRAERLINWCVDCESAISDIEVEYEDEAGAFWYVRYALADDAGNATS